MGEFIKYLDKFLKLKPNLLKQKIIRKSKSSKKEKSDSDYESDSESKSKSKSKSKLKLNLSKYKGKTIVFTGFRDKEIEEQLEQIGSKISGSVSKNTELLVASDPNENSNKIVKAKELEIEVISKEEFYKRIGK